MEKKHFYFEIFSRKRKNLLPLLKMFKERFYLAGGTALALQLGHRDSIDFDFFTNREFNSNDLLEEVKSVFAGHHIEVVQIGNMTLNLIIDHDIKVSFFMIKDRLLDPLIETEYFNLASIKDIACMKIAALTRAEFKDYVDLYYILRRMSLAEIFQNCKKKYENFDEIIYLKAFTSFDDISVTKILFKPGKEVKLSTIRKDFQNKAKEYLDQLRRKIK